jgi:hypothetical protein
MKFAASIRILFVLILASGFIDQYNSNIISTSWAKSEMAGHPSTGGNFCSHAFTDVEHGDDLISGTPSLPGLPLIILTNTVSIFASIPVLADLSPCWQPPESQA